MYYMYIHIFLYIYTYFVVVIVDGAVDVGSWQLSMLEVAKKQKCGYRLTNFIDLDASNLRETIAHQEFQVPKMEGCRNLIRLLWGVGFPLHKPYIQLI